MMETVYYSATTYQNVNSSIVSKSSMNNFNEMLPLARMFPLAGMHRRLGGFHFGTTDMSLKTV